MNVEDILLIVIMFFIVSVPLFIWYKELRELREFQSQRSKVVDDEKVNWIKEGF